MRKLVWILAGVLALMTTGCGVAATDRSNQPAATAESGVVTALPAATAVSIPNLEPTRDSMTEPQPPAANVPAALVETARALLATHLNQPADSLALRDGQARDWPDPSLGCPQPGMMYPQVIVPGFQLVFQGTDGVYTVNIGGRRAIMCVAGRAVELGAVEDIVRSQ